MAFELGVGTLDDLDDIVDIYILARSQDEVWTTMMKAVTPKDQHDFVVRSFTKQLEIPDHTFYKITEVATRRIVAWTRLAHPFISSQPIVQKSQELPRGINLPLWMEFQNVILPAAKRYGYNPEKDYQRRATMVHPNFQRKGLGTWLTRHCNALADKDGCKTYVGATPQSLGMFRKLGFEILGENNLDMVKYGGTLDGGNMWSLVRDPTPLEETSSNPET